MKTCDYFGIILLVFVSIGFLFNTSNVPFFSYGQEQQSRDMIITIPKGSANPEVDVTDLSPRQWYDPREISINVNDTIKWTNNDTEPHTVTSGIGGGLNSLLQIHKANQTDYLIVDYSHRIHPHQSNSMNQEPTTTFVRYTLGWKVSYM